MNSGRLDFAAIYNEFGTFPRKVTSNFQQNLEGATRQPKGSPRGPKDGQREPKATPKEPKGVQGHPKGSQRESKALQREPKGVQGHPKGSQREPKGTPKGAKGSPRPSQRAKGSPRHPKGSQKEPKGTQREPEGAQSHPKGSQRHPKDIQGKSKGQDLYFKLPINRPSGRYVIYIHIYIYGRGNKYCNTLPYGTQLLSTTPKLFFHETGPEQRSRADNRCIRLQMSLRIFFVLTIC